MTHRVGFGIAVVLFAATLSFAQLPPPFSADVKFASKAGNRTGRLFFSGTATRIEIDQTDRPALVIQQDSTLGFLFQNAKFSKTLDLSTHDYWYPHDRTRPCQTPLVTNCQRDSVEVVDGHKWTKWRMRGASQSNLAIWIDESTGITMKIETETGDTMELSNVNIGPQPKSLFKIPAKRPTMADSARPDNPFSDSFFSDIQFFIFRSQSPTGH